VVRFGLPTGGKSEVLIEKPVGAGGFLSANVVGEKKLLHERLCPVRGSTSVRGTWRTVEEKKGILRAGWYVVARGEISSGRLGVHRKEPRRGGEFTFPEKPRSRGREDFLRQTMLTVLCLEKREVCSEQR